jgi:hypothetical protein
MDEGMFRQNLTPPSPQPIDDMDRKHKKRDVTDVKEKCLLIY